jgi:hypothetical protein
MARHGIIDETGMELPDSEAALAEARARAAQALRDGFARGEDRRNWILVMRDEIGSPVAEMTLGEAAGASLSKILV